MSEENSLRYIVEVVYERVVTDGNGTADFHQYCELDTHVMQFSDANKSKARNAADKYFDQCLRRGLTLSGGGVIKSVIPPHNIKNIGLVDYEKYVEEQKALQEAKLEPETLPTDSELLSQEPSQDTDTILDEVAQEHQ
jgi:hypothetical protein